MAGPLNQWPHLALLISILFLFVITPVVAAFPNGVLIVDSLAAIVLISGTYALSQRKRLFVTAVALSGFSVVATWLFLITQESWASILSHSCIIVLIVFFSVTILGYVLQGTQVTVDKIFAAVCVYLLLGYAWTFAYVLVDEIQPGSFFFQLPVPGREYADVLEMRYFSFMTLTTIGYGDIIPRSSTARTLAALEGVAGQIYLTVLIARLVGLHIVHAHRSKKRED